jgi:hypothetical protein
MVDLELFWRKTPLGPLGVKIQDLIPRRNLPPPSETMFREVFEPT